MKRDSKSPVVAQVDVMKVSYSRPKELGIDFTNQIDVWSRMEFRYRHQIAGIGRKRHSGNHEVLRDLTALRYAFREPLD